MTENNKQNPHNVNILVNIKNTLAPICCLCVLLLLLLEFLLSSLPLFLHHMKIQQLLRSINLTLQIKAPPIINSVSVEIPIILFLDVLGGAVGLFEVEDLTGFGFR